VSRRRVCLMLRRWREGEGVVLDLIPGRSSGGRGRGHLPDEVEAVIRELLRTRYLNRQKRSMAAVHRELARICRSRHTEVDLILVDERHRLPIGPPYLTSMASIREWMRGV
jgi:hypothetical protein